jgi:type I restriction enzyme, S subunit
MAMASIAKYSDTRIGADDLDNDNYVGVDNILQNRAGKTSSNYVPQTGKFTCYKQEDILLGNIRPYLKKIWHADRQGGTNGDVLVVRVRDEEKETINSRYLYQILADDKFFDYSMQHAKGAKMPRGNKAAIMNYTIPVPPLEEQERIVSILDKFDALVNDLSSGLPAEIAARRQQYEHYRDRLLTFHEAA